MFARHDKPRRALVSPIHQRVRVAIGIAMHEELVLQGALGRSISSWL